MSLTPTQQSILNDAFSSQRVVPLLNSLRPQSPARIREKVFGEGQIHRNTTLRLRLTDKDSRNRPLTRRGTPGYPELLDRAELIEIDPEPIKIVNHIPAEDFSVFFGDPRNRQARIAEIIEHGRNAIAYTVDALCAQAITGALSYPVYDGRGQVMDVMSLNYGTVKTAATVNFSTMHIDAIIQHIAAMANQVRSGSAPVVCFAGRDVVASIAARARAAKYTDLSFDVAEGYLQLHNLQIWQDDSTYYDYANDKDVPSLGVDEILVVRAGGAHGYVYLPVVNIRGEAVYTPVQVDQYWNADPTEIRIRCLSRPIPYITPSAICRAQVQV